VHKTWSYTPRKRTTNRSEKEDLQNLMVYRIITLAHYKSDAA
jgi:hypothetical protein